MKKYLFILGRNPLLSRAELRNFCDEILFAEDKSLLIGENLKFQNPRNLPKTPEQLFLDRLGGTIRFGEILGELFNEKELQNEILKQIQSQKPEGKIHLGVSGWDCGKTFLRHFLPELKNAFRTKHDRNCRIVNSPGQNLDSGQIFGGKLLQKGFEFLVWKNKNSWLLAQTVANQNLRNYTLRDREKDFRDPHMGMLPPKLAQILINLANPEANEVVIDPFCGSGTINIEAAICGYQTIGSDLDPKRADLAQKNFSQLAEKFRYEVGSGEFFTSDAAKLPLEKMKGIIATEGFLGANFGRKLNKEEVRKNSLDIMKLWEKTLSHLEDSNIRVISFCLPVWKIGREEISLAKNLFAKLDKTSYTPRVLFSQRKTFLYSRPEAFVSREICVLERKNDNPG
ncbi:hypothetical protein K9M41_04355 [Candidatus Gracilibacteria bacterium]|nr:hypothetical protein [Candidatus Gracilibacteria bacterium]